MKFLLMMHVRGQKRYDFESWEEQDRDRHFDFLRRFNNKLTAAGELVEIKALKPTDEAKRVRARDNGVPITDGVFPETKEFLVGFWVIDVASPERAYELAGEASAAPGPGGRPLNMEIEVREVL